ncbi:uncharacterized protein LOC135389325 [Ornithodoros turicata]|uniref:uncharacterized protein LOC135389325 n=1 Tax=Ornithodoros turicata TaxID=34597 RepID=UPI00313957FB
MPCPSTNPKKRCYSRRKSSKAHCRLLRKKRRLKAHATIGDNQADTLQLSDGALEESPFTRDLSVASDCKEVEGSEHRPLEASPGTLYSIANDIAQDPQTSHPESAFCSAGEEDLPDLPVEVNPPVQHEEDRILGRRLISPAHFIKSFREMAEYVCPEIFGEQFTFQKERKVGLWSEFTYKCSGCGQVKKITTDPVLEPTSLVAEEKMMGVNDAAVWAFITIGSGFSNFEESFSVLGVPKMSKGAFLRREEALGEHWEAILMKSIILAGKEEKELALEAGDVCEDGTTAHTKITTVVPTFPCNFPQGQPLDVMRFNSAWILSWTIYALTKL